MFGRESSVDKSASKQDSSLSFNVWLCLVTSASFAIRVTESRRKLGKSSFEWQSLVQSFETKTTETEGQAKVGIATIHAQMQCDSSYLSSDHCKIDLSAKALPVSLLRGPIVQRGKPTRLVSSILSCWLERRETTLAVAARQRAGRITYE